ncbi:hypothetical protein KJ359_007712 [Pestalotiopsis sp. 9143b]|nr:hypothetical protein KJ359_007712 [Pestalotiopsis sp. 9143b]
MDVDEKEGQDGPATASSEMPVAEEAGPVAKPDTAIASPAPSQANTQARPHYTPQFSATTEMILKRIRGEPNNFSSAISSASAAGAINKTSYEDAKRRLVMSMNTSISLPMPTSAPISPPRAVPSIILPKIEVNAKPAPKKRGRPPKAAKAEKVEHVEKKAKLPSGTKRKRVGKDEDDGSSVLSEPPDTEDEEEFQDATPTMTKSGRQILKPNQFNPATDSGTGKRKHYGKRTAEQALCKVCTRGLSRVNNQVVFCDGCNLCWHQMCHEPYIDDDFVSDESRSWFCRGCSAKREKHLAKKKNVSGHKGVSWPSKTLEQAPGNSAANATQENGKIGQADRENSEDIPPAWPRVGAGVLAGINLNEADFEDKNDFEAFSLATFDARSGKKLVENGMPVSSQEAAVS